MKWLSAVVVFVAVASLVAAALRRTKRNNGSGRSKACSLERQRVA